MNPTGPIVDGRGNVTVAWGACGAGQLGCSIAAASGDARGSFGPSRTLATTPRVAAITIQALVGDGDVAIERCGPGSRCSISVAFAGARRHFGKPQRVTADAKRLELLVGDARGDQLLVWNGSDGRERAATRRAGSRRFGPSRTLSAPGAVVDRVTGAFGPRGEALVVWTEPGARGLFAATFDQPLG